MNMQINSLMFFSNKRFESKTYNKHDKKWFTHT